MTTLWNPAMIAVLIAAVAVILAGVTWFCFRAINIHEPSRQPHKTFGPR